MTDLTIKVLDSLDIIKYSLEDTFKRIKSLKEKCDNDEQLQVLIKKYNSLIDNPYSNEFRETKIELFNNSNFKNYNDLINEIDLFIMKVNFKLKKLLPESSDKKCV